MLAIISVGTAPIPYILFMYGERVRRGSRKASKASMERGGRRRDKCDLCAVLAVKVCRCNISFFGLE